VRMFTVPALWQIEVLLKYKQFNDRYGDRARIVEVYGSHANSPFGSGRASLILPRVENAELERHVAEARKLGFSFSYLLNAACMGGFEGTYEGQRQARQFLAFLANSGVDKVTVTSPMLIEFVRACQPDLKIGASVICYVDTVDRLLFFESLGVSRVSLDIDVTRNFPLIRAMRQATGIELGLIVNSLCRLGCPLKTYHYNMNAHFSQTGRYLDESGKTLVETMGLQYVGGRCMLQNHVDKASALKAAWVRPEDLSHYSDAGIDIFKIQGRGAEPENMLRTIEMYMAGHIPVRYASMTLFAAGRSSFTLDNEALDGFINFFVRDPYSCNQGCNGCGYCDRWAERAVIADDEIMAGVRATGERLRTESLTFDRRIDQLTESLMVDSLMNPPAPGGGQRG